MERSQGGQRGPRELKSDGMHTLGWGRGGRQRFRGTKGQ